MIDVDYGTQLIPTRNFPAQLRAIYIEIARDDQTLVLGGERILRELFLMRESPDGYRQAFDSGVMVRATIAQ